MRLCIASQFMSGGSGGIARVARLTAKVAHQQGYQVAAFAAAKACCSSAAVVARSASGMRIALASCT